MPMVDNMLGSMKKNKAIVDIKQKRYTAYAKLATLVYGKLGYKQRRKHSICVQKAVDQFLPYTNGEKKTGFKCSRDKLSDESSSDGHISPTLEMGKSMPSTKTSP